MSIIGEAVQAENMEQMIDEEISPADFSEPAAPKSRISDMMPDFSVLLSPTGPGPIENYIDHPLNLHGSSGSARMIRGFTGIAGNLDYAIIDITLGAIEVYQEGHRKKEVSNELFTIPE